MTVDLETFLVAVYTTGDDIYTPHYLFQWNYRLPPHVSAAHRPRPPARAAASAALKSAWYRYGALYVNSRA